MSSRVDLNNNNLAPAAAPQAAPDESYISQAINAVSAALDWVVDDLRNDPPFSLRDRAALQDREAERFALNHMGVHGGYAVMEPRRIQRPRPPQPAPAAAPVAVPAPAVEEPPYLVIGAPRFES